MVAATENIFLILALLNDWKVALPDQAFRPSSGSPMVAATWKVFLILRLLEARKMPFPGHFFLI